MFFPTKMIPESSTDCRKEIEVLELGRCVREILKEWKSRGLEHSGRARDLPWLEVRTECFF